MSTTLYYYQPIFFSLSWLVCSDHVLLFIFFLSFSLLLPLGLCASSCLVHLHMIHKTTQLKLQSNIFFYKSPYTQPKREHDYVRRSTENGCFTKIHLIRGRIIVQMMMWWKPFSFSHPYPHSHQQTRKCHPASAVCGGSRTKKHHPVCGGSRNRSLGETSRWSQFRFCLSDSDGPSWSIKGWETDISIKSSRYIREFSAACNKHCPSFFSHLLHDSIFLTLRKCS